MLGSECAMLGNMGLNGHQRVHNFMEKTRKKLYELVSKCYKFGTWTHVAIFFNTNTKRSGSKMLTALKYMKAFQNTFFSFKNSSVEF